MNSTLNAIKPHAIAIPGHRELYFAHARSALSYGLVQLGMRPRDAILVPDYVCGVVTDAIEAAGFRCIYYPVSDLLEPMMDALAEHCVPQVRALLIIHYFGRAQRIERLQQFADERGIFLVEDNAHSFGGAYSGRMLGTYGDIGISSPRKFLPIRNGGVLYWNRPDKPVEPVLSTQPGAVLWGAKRLVKRALERYPAFYSKLRRRPDYFDETEGAEAPLQAWAFDQDGLKFMQQLDYDRFLQTRRTVWHVWHRWAAEHGLSPLFHDLEEGANPWCYPARISEESERRYWFDWGWRNGIEISSWPALPQAVIANQLSGYRHWKSIVRFAIPVSLRSQEFEERLIRAR